MHIDYFIIIRNIHQDEISPRCGPLISGIKLGIHWDQTWDCGSSNLDPVLSPQSLTSIQWQGSVILQYPKFTLINLDLRSRLP